MPPATHLFCRPSRRPELGRRLTLASGNSIEPLRRRDAAIQQRGIDHVRPLGAAETASPAGEMYDAQIHLDDSGYGDAGNQHLAADPLTDDPVKELGLHRAF
jgi:hypothetical protein